MATWKILGQDDSTSTGTGSTGRRVVYTNGTTNGTVAWGVLHNRTAGAITGHLWVSTSTAIPDQAKIHGQSIPANDTQKTFHFTMSTGDSVIWAQSSTGLSVSVFGAEGIAT